MKSRQEVRAEQQATAQPAAPVVNHHHHPFRTFWGMVALALLVTSLILGQTIFNKRFVKKEIHRSDLATLVDNSLTSSLSQYGVSGDVVTKSDTNHLLDQAVDQVYAGQSLKLDFSPVIDRAGNSVTKSVAGVNLPTGVLSSSAGSALTTALSHNLNSQLNTAQVEQFTQWLHILVLVNQIVFWVSLVIVVLVVIGAVLSRQLLPTLTWISAGALVIVIGLIQVVKAALQSVGQRFPDYSAFLVQLATDFSHQAMTLWWVLVAVVIVSIVLRLSRRWLKWG